MRIALKELIRRPGRFVTATVILTLIAILLMFLGGLLDGLIRASTGVLRSRPSSATKTIDRVEPSGGRAVLS